MKYKIMEIDDNKKKAEYTNIILRKLPEWFGNEEGIQNFVNTVNLYPYWAAFDRDNCIGFFSGKIHHNRTGDIYVCGVNPNYHRKGIGKLLYKELEEYCIEKSCEYIIVKTVYETDTEKYYGKTVQFYKSIGFRELITLPEIWDKNNPCLLMINKLSIKKDGQK
jgi:ribosomal protein S18 acetylase RimI-like enzyme